MNQLNQLRTVNEFVEDTISDGRTESEVIIIAQNSHWRTKLNEVKEYLIRLRRRMEKRKNCI